MTFPDLSSIDWSRRGPVLARTPATKVGADTTIRLLTPAEEIKAKFAAALKYEADQRAAREKENEAKLASYGATLTAAAYFVPGLGPAAALAVGALTSITVGISRALSEWTKDSANSESEQARALAALTRFAERGLLPPAFASDLDSAKGFANYLEAYLARAPKGADPVGTSLLAHREDSEVYQWAALGAKSRNGMYGGIKEAWVPMLVGRLAALDTGGDTKRTQDAALAAYGFDNAKPYGSTSGTPDGGAEAVARAYDAALAAGKASSTGAGSEGPSVGTAVAATLGLGALAWMILL